MAKKIEIQNIYPLSSMQEGLLFQSLLNQKSTDYVLQTEFSICGTIEPKLFQEAFQRLIDRYDILRTIFTHKKKRPLQIVLRHRKAEVQLEDYRELETVERERAVTEFKRCDLERGFDLTKDLLIRTAILRTEEQACKLILTYHHILMDGWCLGVIFHELTEIYRSLLAGNEPILETPYPYGHYIKWLEAQDRSLAANFWEQVVEGYDQPALLPRTGTILAPGKFEMRKRSFALDQTVTKQLHQIAQETQVTLYTVMQTLWGVLLQKCNNTDDVIFGAVVAGRPAGLPGVERMVGLFINTIPVRIKDGHDISFSDLLQQVQRNTVEGNPHEYFPLHQVFSRSSLKQNLFNHIIAFENYLLHEEMLGSSDSETGFTITDVETYEQTQYDFHVIFVPGESLQVHMTYNALVYLEEDTVMIERYFRDLVRVILQSLDKPLLEVELVSTRERHQQLSIARENLVLYPEHETLTSLFEAQAVRTPDRIAVVCGEESLTYRELNEQANRVSRRLQQKGTGADRLVALMVDRKPEMIVAMLAVLKAGGGYVPIDPDYPPDRIRFMLEDSGACVLLTEPEHVDKALGTSIEILQLQDALTERDTSNPPPASQPEHLAYVIYTSGTTGLPKGVMVEHRNVVRLFFHERNLFDFGPDDVWTMFHSYCFDFSVWEMYGALLHGGRLVLVPKEAARDPQAFRLLLSKEKVTILNQTPTMFYQLIEEEKRHPEQILHVRNVIFGGEALAPYQLREWRCRYPQTTLINMYGITETTVHVTYKEIDDVEIESNLCNIGRPIPTLSLYVLDRGMNLLPPGMTGEIYVGGEGVARGYLNRPELTAERFLSNPYLPGDVLYKTGDLARWMPNGNLEYLGRADHQVKIRGYRIETGEIEYNLSQFNGVHRAVVLPRVTPGRPVELCAYLTAAVPLVAEDLRTFLQDTLPAYMVPAFFYQVDTIPYTSNGKVDASVLRASGKALGFSEASIKPLGAVEQSLYELWTQVLGHDRFGVYDHFLEVGGNSILLIQLHNQLQERFPGKLTIADLFTFATIAQLTDKVTETVKAPGAKALKGILLPREYYAAGTGTIAYRYVMTSDLMERLDEIAALERANVTDILQGLFLYVLAEVTQAAHVALHLVKSGKACQAVFEREHHSNFGDLFRLVAAVKADANLAYDGEDVYRARLLAERGTVFAAFAEEGERLAPYDFGIEWQAATVELRMVVNQDRVAAEKLQTLHKQFIGFIKHFTQQYTSVQGS
ncbi:amino acid adenylation domain-containing protein [Brevibacillus sp. AG162]|uniref:non-ribosomal peptide synthetase n=1 Tax=Brevibacillus sp. AG162 TaxID=2572910 RepID=UPI00114F76F5|nr:non-ribosomal peptide synthetase [Brevibacillus sp. AG162]TQK53527.1 amino acid adenylation domain-containing protein [Brevibacillus sp. AG162]